MAEPDGRITINTELDTDGFKRGSSKLLSSINSLEKRVSDLGGSFQRSFAGAADGLRARAGSFSRAAQAADQAAKSTDQYEKALAKLQKQIDAAEQKLKDYYNQLETIHAGAQEDLKRVTSADQAANVREMEKVQVEALNQKYASQLSVLKQLQEEQYRLLDLQEQAKASQNEGAEEHTSAFERMINNVRKYAHEAKKATIDSNKLVRSLTSLKRLMITRIKRMFISAIFKEVQTQLASLRQYYGAYNAAMERINGATSRAGAGIAIAIAHLVVTAEPFIVKLINLLTKAIEKISKFISLLTGVKNISSNELATYTQQLQQASQAQEEFNADLYGFDELNRQSKNVGTPTGGSSSSGGSGVGISPGSSEAQETDSWLDGLKDNMGDLRTTALGIGAAIATWAVGNKILKMMGKSSAMAKVRLAGLALAIGGAVVYARNFFDAWKNGLSNANIDGMFGSAAVAAAGLGVALKSLVAGGITLAVGGFGMIVAGAKEWIKTGELTNESFKSLEFGIISLGAGLALALPGIGGTIAAIVAAVAAGALAIYKNWDSIKAALVNGLLAFGDFWDSSVQPKIEACIDWVVNAWNTCGKWIAMAGQTIKTWLINGFWAINDWWIGTAEPAIGAAIDWIISAWQWVIQGFTDFFAEIGLIGQLMMDLAWEMWSTISTAIVTAVTTAVQTVQAKWNEFKTNTVATFTTIKAKITSDIQTAKANMVAAVTSAKASVVASWNALLAACKSIFTGVKSTIMTMIYQASNFIASQSWYGYGVNLIQGFWNGLRSLMSAVWQGVVDFCRRCAEAVRDALRIGSPSKVFEELGEFTGMGFVEGLKNEESAAVKTAANLADAVTEEMSGSSSVDLSANGIQSVVNGLSTIAGIFQTIAKTLGAIGGLSMPQMSVGTVVPYRARVDGHKTSENESTDAVALLTSILAELQGLVQVIRSTGSNGTQIIKVIADGREIFNLVVDENNRAIQRTGQSPIRV